MEFNECNFEYCTPKYIVDMFGKFDYDPCTTKEGSTNLGIPNYSTIDSDGLRADWGKYKRIWINPPTYLIFPFLEKAVYTYQKAHNDIYYLGPISMLTTKAFHETIEGFGIKLYIPNGRIKFRNIAQDTEEAPPFGCVIFKIQSQNEIRFFNIVVPGQYSILNETDVK